MILDFELPECNKPPFPPPRIDNERYGEFVDFNLSVVRENGNGERVLKSRLRPVEEIFVLE